ncbi:hypothetical protein [Cellulomonas massiliensis]|uniref:hypothetical protein n=1 Tax=Cellulomonas massiliensis TaxID=1465811 RepID=UPI00031213DF|nr:hypothetical protein [Cellulomonas massiliensis]
MGLAEQQEQLGAVARRFAQVAPQGWARLLGNWEATVDGAGAVSLNWITTAVVDGGDRWLYGQVAYDEPLYDAVVRLNELSAQDGPDRRWTTLDLRLDADGAIAVDLGYDEPKRTNGVHDEESLGRFEQYLDTWVAEHGPVPAGREG